MTSKPDTPAAKSAKVQGEKPGMKASGGPKLSHAEARQQRLEEQLRANLKKRKDQVRSRAAARQSESEDEI